MTDRDVIQKLSFKYKNLYLLDQYIIKAYIYDSNLAINIFSEMPDSKSILFDIHF